MRKYLRMVYGFFKASAIADLEYRLNFVVKVATDVIWYTAQLSVFEVLFSHTNSISGWTLESMRVFMGMLFVTDALWMMLFSENLDRLSDKVRRGDLDLLLVKPVNSQFMMSLQRMNPAYALNFLLAFGWLVWSLGNLPEAMHWMRLFMLIITIPCSLAVGYSMRFFFSATALIFTRAENINYVWYQLYRLGTRPDTIYPTWLRYTVLTILPVGFLASVPTRLILNAPNYALLSALIGISVILLYLSTRYWKLALKFYSSASS
jgi:ABC-2 type transport system permease protein